MKFLENLKQVFKRKNKNEVKLLKGIDVDNIYTDPRVSEEIRKTIKENKEKIRDLADEYEDTKKTVDLFSKVNKLSTPDLYELEDDASKYSDLLIRRSFFKDLVEKQDKETRYLERFKEEIPQVIERLREYESNQGDVKRDLSVLEGEKSELNYKKNVNIGAFGFVKVFLIFVVLIAAIAALLFATLALIYEKDVIVPGLITVVAIIIATLWAAVFRRNLSSDIRKNQKLQKRAVELLNKTRIKYVANQNILDYEYAKYRVNSSEMLVLRWKNFQANLENEREYTSIESEITTIKAKINRLLLRNHMEELNQVIEHIDFFMSEESRNNYLDSQKKILEDLLKELEFYKKQSDLFTEILQNYES